jgi:hypothetical protein
LEIGDKALDLWIHESEKSDLSKYKGEIIEFVCGYKFPEREIEEPLPRDLRASDKGKILLTWTFQPAS